MNFSDATDIRLGSSTITALYYGSTLIWPTTPPTPVDWSTEYLQVEALEPLNLTTAMPISKTEYDILDVQYSYNKVNWYSWNEDISISLTTGDKVYFKGSYLSTFTSPSTTARPGAGIQYELCRATTGTRYNVQGNIMSLIYGDNFVNQYSLQGYSYCFYRLFCDNLSITDMTNLILPATTLADYCYALMFDDCTALTIAPTLPATTLTDGCYSNMFAYCTSLTTAPALPATALADGCYNSMFYGCSSLVTSPALPATTLADNCYAGMFKHCTALTTAPALPATTLADHCYLEMFYGCTLLVTAPALPATTLAYDCYNEMFAVCTALTTAPVLPATTLTDYCYVGMFTGCTSLNYIKCLATDMTATDCLNNWTYNVASSGTFIKDANTTWSTGSSGIPSGWNVQNA